MERINRFKAFTLIELLVVIGIIAILAAIVIIAVKPGRQTAQARNTQRRSDVKAIIDAVQQQAADNKGILLGGIPLCSDTSYPNGKDTGSDVANDFYAQSSSVAVSLGSLLAPNYIVAMPKDPSEGTDAITKYAICRSSMDANTSITVTNTATLELVSTPVAITR